VDQRDQAFCHGDDLIHALPPGDVCALTIAQSGMHTSMPTHLLCLLLLDINQVEAALEQPNY
jgi:hypothetical protein